MTETEEFSRRISDYKLFGMRGNFSLGAFASILLSARNAAPALFIFVALKIFMDVRAHNKEHAKAASPAV